MGDFFILSVYILHLLNYRYYKKNNFDFNFLIYNLYECTLGCGKLQRMF